MNVSAIKARFRRGVEAVNLALNVSNMLEDAHKLGASQIADFAPP